MIRQYLYLAASAIVTVALLAACGGEADNAAQNAVPSEQHSSAASASPTATSHEHALPSATATPATQTVASATAAATATTTATPSGHEHMMPTATQAVASPTATPSSEAAQAVEVQILDFSFDPPLLEITAGTTVTFINQGVDHTATSIGEPRVFDSGIMKTGDRFTFTFDTAGSYDYWCLLHPNMIGSIIVE